MPGDRDLFDDSLFDSGSGAPDLTQRVYPPSIVDPPRQIVRPPGIPSGVAFGTAVAGPSVRTRGIASRLTFGRVRVTISVGVPSIAPVLAFGSVTAVPGPVTVKVPSIYLD